MERKNQIEYIKYKIPTSPILKYYFPKINQNNELYNLDILKINSSKFPQISDIQISFKNKVKDIIESTEENIIEEKEKLYTKRDNNFKLKSEVEIKKIESNNNINKINIKKDMKKITPKDLILINMNNNNSILRINPEIYRNESYEFLSSNLYILLKDQLGCRFLQEKLEVDTYNALYHFLPSLIPNIKELIQDSFANYFIQKIFVYLNEEQIELILKIIEPDFLEICINNHGTRVIQCIIDFLTTDKLKNLFFKIIKPVFIDLIKELNSTHIIYKLLTVYPEFLASSNEIIINNIISISTHKRGCVFLEKYLSFCVDINLRKNLIQSILKNCLILIIDPIGNYILQYLLSFEDSDITLNIINQIIKNIGFYCKHRYANYVIEKIIIHSNYKQKQNLIEIIAKKEIISDLALAQQGNFIILKVLKFADKNQRLLILDTINNLKTKIQEMPHGKKFLTKIQSLGTLSNNK